MGFRLKHFEAFCNSSNSIFAAVNLLLLCVYQIVDVATMSVIHSWATKRMFARPRNSTDADECKFDSLPYRFTFCLCTVQWTLNNAYMPSIFDFNLQRYFARTLFLFTVPFLSSLPSFRNFFFSFSHRHHHKNIFVLRLNRSTERDIVRVDEYKHTYQT